MSTYALAEKYGCNRRTITKRLQKMGVQTRTGRPRLKLDDEQIKEDYLSTRNLTLVAEKHHCTPGTIKDRLQAMGITDTSSPGVTREAYYRSLSTIKERYGAFLERVCGFLDVKIEYDDTLPDTVEAVLDTLHDQEATVLRLLHGLSGQPPMTHTEIGNTLGISHQRVIRLAASGGRQLRHPFRSVRFQKYLKPLEDDRMVKVLQHIHTYLRRELRELRPEAIHITIGVPEQVHRDLADEYPPYSLTLRMLYLDVGEWPDMTTLYFHCLRPREENDE
jgi:hypothetical protein